MTQESIENTQQFLTSQLSLIKKKNRTKHLYYFIAFFLVSLLVPMIFKKLLLVETPSEESLKMLNMAFYSISIVMSLFYGLTLTLSTDFNILKNKDEVPLYDALQFIYHKYNDGDNVEFMNFIDVQYEKQRLSELQKVVTSDKELYQQKQDEINKLFENKEFKIAVSKALRQAHQA